MSSTMAPTTAITGAAATSASSPPTTGTSSTATRTSDCRKFSPNIFNKSKCSHCFRQREEHSAAALECNRASRKVSKCGYLFVAPDWDFSNPLYRTKRWQRRWFVLYDDGELTYSVDEHPETVPQACIDMTKVLEVTTAEDVTGHSNSIAITAPDRVTFVKGTCPEESKWWLNILIAFPKSKGRHKRNATFPGAQSTSTILQSSHSDATSTTTVSRNRHNSYHKDILTSTQSTGILNTSTCSVGDERQMTTAASSLSKTNNNTNGSSKLWSPNDVADASLTNTNGNSGSKKGSNVVVSSMITETTGGMKNNRNNNIVSGDVASVVDDDDGVETGEDDEEDDEEEDEEESGNSTGEESNTKNKTTSSVHDENNRNAVNEIKNRVSPPCLLIEDIRRDEKTIKDLANTITNLSQQQKNRWSSTAVNNVLNSINNNKSQQDDKNSRDEPDFYRPITISKQSAATNGDAVNHLRPKSLPLASNSTPAIVSAIVKKIPPVLATTTTTATSKSSLRYHHQPQQHHYHNQQQQQQQQNRSKQQKQALERGDPDGGCNLDDLTSSYLSKTVELRVNPGPPHSTSGTTSTTTPTSSTPSVLGESLNAKKGWLMKQDNRSGDWTKHWFTLSGAALFYYRDPVSEERGVLDGVLDVNSLTNVAEVNANRNYAFQLTTWDKRRLILASLSPNSRNSWIAILRNAAGLPNSSVVNATSAAGSTATNNANAQCSNGGALNLGNQSNCPSDSSLAKEQKNKSIPITTELIIKDNSSDDMKSEIEKDFIKAQRIMQSCPESSSIQGKVKKLSSETSPKVIITNVSTTASTKPATTLLSPQTPLTPKTALHFSSDEEYRTASEGGRRDSIGDWGSPLSPSPPTTLNLMRAKDRMRPRTTTPCPRMHKRSRSSPPSSRRSTVDSVGSDELPLIHTVHEEINLNVDKELQFRLSVVEKERDMLRNEAKEREARMSELLNTLERTEQELNSRIQEMEEVRESLTTQLEDAKRNAAEIIERISDDLEESQKKVKDLEDRLAQGIEENENLYKRLREMESCSPASFINLQRYKMKRMDSLSDLTQIKDIDPYGLERDLLADEYSELKGRFEKAVTEIRAMKKELKDSQNQYDSLEISYASLKQDMERKEIEDQSQLQMMADRIQDLTLKYSSSDRQVRSLKQKLAKSERRRSLSLKGKEQLTVSKELEIKLNDLETKIEELEKSHHFNIKQPILENPPVVKSATKKSSRRRSLESSASDSLQFLVRVNDLEKRCEGALNTSRSSSSTPTPNSNTPTLESPPRSSPAGNLKLSEHLLERLKCLENVLVSSKDLLEQSLSQLQNLRSSRNRRSVSPITDRKDSYRFVERCLQEVVKLIRESTETCVLQGSQVDVTQPSSYMLPDSSPVKKALTQLESQLRSKLAELLKQRRMLRERNELTKTKDLELLAERIAFESVCFGKLRDSVERAENPELFSQRQTRAEVAETSHLMSMLKAKLQGKCTVKTSGSLDILAGVLARRLLLSSYQRNHGTSPTSATAPTTDTVKLSMEPVDQNMLDDLLRQQNEINVIAKRYKNNAMEKLATSLAAETLSYISTNDLVQGAVQEAWRQAQETVNAELVQSEIAHIMMRNAERLENSLAPSFGYTLTSEERMSFEKFADAVHDVLRKEMELAVTQLTQCYEETMQKMKRGQWRMHLQHEHKTSEGRQLLSEFADIVAHKALIDARIDVLRGDCPSEVISKIDEEKEITKLGITALQKYENLFEELSSDLQITNPNDILLEADFEFMYKQHAVDFLSDRQVLCDISSFLSQLEDSLIALQCEATSSNEHIPRTEISIESLQDVCHKCCELRKRADQLLQEVHRKLNDSCQHCLQVREKLHSLKEQHESEIIRLQQSHAKDLAALMQQVEHQRSTIRCLEAEKNAINQDLNKSEELMEERERELQTLTQMLHTKEDALQTTQGDQREILKRLEAEEEKVRSYQEESDALKMKCARQDDEYVMLLQERDYIQSELNKELEHRKRLEKRVELLEMEHGKQMECLQQAYRDQMLTHCPDFSNVIDEESFRQRYQGEIEQLRTLCEKGLSAMESSHRRTINDLEEKHKQEIERLLIEKETALAEETQATLAALDAMRKAHQSEVQREVARFKQEFLKQFQQKGERTLDSTKAKEEELEELRQEILSFSEKYSIKCVENAALEEKLRAANQKLKHYQQMQQLELRNKQFRAHLASEDPTKDMLYVQGLTRQKDDGDDNVDEDGAVCQDSEHVHATRDYNQYDSRGTTMKDEWDNDEIHRKLCREQVHGQNLKQQQQQQRQHHQRITTLQTSKTIELLPPTTSAPHQPLKQKQHHQQLQSIIIRASDNTNRTPVKTCSEIDQKVFLGDDADDDDDVDIHSGHSNCHDADDVAATTKCTTTTTTPPPYDTTSITNNTESIATITPTKTTTNISNIICSSSTTPPTTTTTPNTNVTTLPVSGASGLLVPIKSPSDKDSNNSNIGNPKSSIELTADVGHGTGINSALTIPVDDEDNNNKDNDVTADEDSGGSKHTSDGVAVVGSQFTQDIDDNLAPNNRYSYEPCYKQTNLFNYQNRMLNFEDIIEKATAGKFTTTGKSNLAGDDDDKQQLS
ncbi:myosin phosphatase Rho interacting protein outspread isoform X2 [Haematobia irritans]|uniref:myosin phosphatase Rho interacting protein outspread isoform X2 n=1 Tax=Haematobia irritans TaxID=7368 RepID=UPI003F503A15